MQTMRKDADPQRRCIVTGQSLPREDLLRFVVAPDGAVVPDLDEKLPGRGLWLRAERDILRTACAKGAFSKAARRETKLPDDLAAQVERLLRRRCLDLIGLARRSGALTAGFEKVRAFLASEDAGALIAASDGAADGRAKIRALAPEMPMVDALTAEELGAAIGREHIVHAVVAKGRLAERLLHEARRLTGVRGNAGKAEQTERIQ
jgi:predicted RNA-binding protein YlxR (DUF448 family)/ribosomal protein L30E